MSDNSESILYDAIPPVQIAETLTSIAATLEKTDDKDGRKVLLRTADALLGLFHPQVEPLTEDRKVVGFRRP
jgi:hypothetical protein